MALTCEPIGKLVPPHTYMGGHIDQCCVNIDVKSLFSCNLIPEIRSLLSVS